jgi:hypothetical protein
LQGIDRPVRAVGRLDHYLRLFTAAATAAANAAGLLSIRNTGSRSAAGPLRTTTDRRRCSRSRRTLVP